MARRLTLTYLLVTLIGLLLLGGGFVALAARYEGEQRQRELQAQAALYADFVAALAISAAQLQALAPGLATAAILPTDVQARIFSTGGVLLTAEGGLGPFPSRPAHALVHGLVPLPLSQVSDRRYAAQRVEGSAGPIGIVELSHPMSEEAAFQKTLIALILQAALAATGVMALVSMVVARSLAGPLVRLAKRAEQLADDPAAILHPSPPAKRVARDELARMGQSLDYLAAQLRARIAETEGERVRLAAILASISEGVIALDADGIPVRANPAALILTNSTSPQQALERLQTAGLDRAAHPADEAEVALDGRTLLLNVALIGDEIASNELRAVLTIRDLSRLRELEQARTRFYRSVSHELRTPLTAMRSAIENLSDDATPDQQRMLQLLDAETARIARLVEELLRAPKEGNRPLVRRRIDVGQLVGELVALQQGRAKRAGITLTWAQSDRLPQLLGDRDRMKQALLNLLDNAMRVTPPGGLVDMMVSTPNPPSVHITVTDTGPGVPAALRERIWERGVRGADLGQAGVAAAGGAGLGLAIVREIVGAHGGRAFVAEHGGTGARFVVELPVE